MDANTNLIPVRRSGHRILSSQCYATSSYDQQNGHLKVPEVHYVVTRTTHPEGEQMRQMSHSTSGTVRGRGQAGRHQSASITAKTTGTVSHDKDLRVVRFEDEHAVRGHGADRIRLLCLLFL